MRLTLPACWLPRCQDFGERLAALYKDRPDYPTLINDIDRNVPLLAHSKAGEVAFALMHKLEPDHEVKWSVTIEGNRHHWDVMLNSRRVDVKTAARLYNPCRLIWPEKKWRDFERAEFDVLALMSGRDARFVWHGCVSKDRFRRDHRIAGEGEALDAGVRYMLDSELDQPPEIWPDCP